MNAPLRSTEQLLTAAERAALAGEVLILAGNTGDVFVGPSGEVSRLPHLLAGMAGRNGRGCITYSGFAGARQLAPQGQQPLRIHLPPVDVPTARALGEILRELSTLAQPVLLIVDWGDLALPTSLGAGHPQIDQLVEILGACAVDPVLAERGHRFVIVGRAGGIDSRLAALPGFASYDIAIPDRAEREALIRRLTEADGDRKLHLAPDLPVDRAAALTGGLRLDDLLRGRSQSSPEAPITMSWIQARKTETLRKIASQGLSVYPPGIGLAGVAGLPQIRRLVAEAKATGRVPRRILLAGPPGVGKTLVVTAIADELGLPAVALGQYMSRYVGDSERIIREVLNAVQALSPCVLHIDEFDQAIGQRNTGQSADGGTSERVFAELLTFLGDNQRAERVTVIGTTNRPDALDSAMFDRFTIIPVLHPTPSEAVAVLEIEANRQERTVDLDAALEVVLGFDHVVTGRLLVEVLERAATFADLRSPGSTISGSDLGAARTDLLMALDPIEHEFLALQSINLCTFRSFLPWVSSGFLGHEPHIPGYLAPMMDDEGELVPTRLRERIVELRMAVGA